MFLRGPILTRLPSDSVVITKFYYEYRIVPCVMFRITFACLLEFNKTVKVFCKMSCYCNKVNIYTYY